MLLGFFLADFFGRVSFVNVAADMQGGGKGPDNEVLFNRLENPPGGGGRGGGLLA